MSKYNLKTMSDEQFEQQYAEATARSERELQEFPKALSARLDAASMRLVLEMETGVTLLVPVNMIQGLQTEDIAALADFEVVANGTQIHWNELDAQFYIGGVLNGEFGTKKWMNSLREHLSAIGKKGGRSRSEAKRAASAENGKKGGRPKSRRTA